VVPPDYSAPRTAQACGMVRSPLPGAAIVTGRAEPKCKQRMNALLALRNVYRLAPLDCRAYLGQLVGQTWRVAPAPAPSPRAVRVKVGTALGAVAHEPARDAVPGRAGLVSVVARARLWAAVEIGVSRGARARCGR